MSKFFITCQHYIKNLYRENVKNQNRVLVEKNHRKRKETQIHVKCDYPQFINQRKKRKETQIHVKCDLSTVCKFLVDQTECIQIKLTIT